MSDRISAGDAEDRKLKRKIEEKTEDLLTLRLGSNYHVGGEISGTSSSSASKAESRVGESSFSASKRLRLGVGVGVDVDVEPSRRRRRHRKQRVFTCKFCKRSFKSMQAMGGHQNAHRRERTLMNMKMDKELELVTSNLAQLRPFSLNNSPTATNFPFRGGSVLSHSGAHMHQHQTMTHLAPAAGAMYWPRHGYGYGDVLHNSPPSANRYGLEISNGTAAPTAGVNIGAGGWFGSPSWLFIPNANSVNIGGHQGNDYAGNNQQRGSATEAREEQDLDLSLRL